MKDTLWGKTREQHLAEANADLYRNYPTVYPDLKVDFDKVTKASRRVRYGTIYVAGPMRGYKDFNFPAFHAATARLADLGWDVMSPAANDADVQGFDPTGLTGNEHPEGFDLIAALKWDMESVLRADAIYMLKGWERSKGARAEYNLADAAGKQILFEEGAAQPASNDLLTKAGEVLHLYWEGQEDDAEEKDFPIKERPSTGFGNAGKRALSSGEVRTTSATGGQKGTKPERYDLIPVEALAEVARVYALGAEKYEDHNWRKGYDWSHSYAALSRHINAFWGGEDYDPEFGTKHLGHAVFHLFTLMTFMDEQPGFDNRFKPQG